MFFWHYVVVLLITTFIWMGAVPVVVAQPSKTEELTTLQGQLASEKDKQAGLKKKMAAAESELASSRKTMVSLGKDLQASEQALSTLEQKIKDLQAEQAELQSRLESDYGSMGNLILALQRLRRMPPETLIIRPGAPLQTAQSAMLLQSILPAVNARATELSANLERLKTIHESLEKDKVKAIETSSTLKDQKAEMQTMVQKRERLFRQTRTAYDDQAEAIARMASEAETLQQLVARIQDLDRQQKIEDGRQAGKTKRVANVKMPSLPGGPWQKPVSGTIAIQFGENDEIGARSQGIKINTRPSALVTAPAGGIVRFAGPFRNYGNMVIIEHDKGFHSLMSGLSRIDLSAGQKISAGEPVGTMPGSGADHAPRLYYELRHDGKPVDPAAKFPGLS